MSRNIFSRKGRKGDRFIFISTIKNKSVTFLLNSVDNTVYILFDILNFFPGNVLLHLVDDCINGDEIHIKKSTCPGQKQSKIYSHLELKSNPDGVIKTTIATKQKM